MRSESAALRLRVILVTTRAALRHASDDRPQRRAIVQRGRDLVDGLAADLDGTRSATADGAFEEAYAELEGLDAD